MKGSVVYFDLGDTLVYGPQNNRQPFDDAIETIDELWNRGYKIGLLSDRIPGTTHSDNWARLGDSIVSKRKKSSLHFLPAASAKTSKYGFRGSKTAIYAKLLLKKRKLISVSFQAK